MRGMAGGRALIPKNAFEWPTLSGLVHERVGSFSPPFCNFYLLPIGQAAESASDENSSPIGAPQTYSWVTERKTTTNWEFTRRIFLGRMKRERGVP